MAWLSERDLCFRPLVAGVPSLMGPGEHCGEERAHGGRGNAGVGCEQKQRQYMHTRPAQCRGPQYTKSHTPASNASTFLPTEQQPNALTHPSPPRHQHSNPPVYLKITSQYSHTPQLPTNFPTPPHPTAQYSNPPALLHSPNSSPKFLCQHSDIHPNPPKHPKITVPYPMLFFISTFQPSYTPQNNSLKYVRPVHPDTSWSDISIQTPQTFHTP